jgi:hypothetical protein
VTLNRVGAGEGRGLKRRAPDQQVGESSASVGVVRLGAREIHI